MNNPYDRLAEQYDHYAVLQQEVADRLIDRLSFFKIKPKRILEIACATGYFTKKLSEMYPDAAITAVDFSENMLKIAKQKQLPNAIFLHQDIFQSAFRAGQFDAIVFNCFPEDQADLSRLFERCHAWLALDGFLMFSTFGLDTLKELRTAFTAIDQHHHVNAYMDMHPIGDLLLQLGFFQPVMNAEWITLTYHQLQGLWDDLQGTGTGVHDAHARKGLMTPRELKIVEATYDDLRVDDLYPATYEIIFGMAEKRAPESTLSGEVNIPISSIQKGK